MKLLPLWLLSLLALPLGFSRAAAPESQDLPKPTSRTVKKLHGWTVRVDDRLFLAPNDVLGARALKLLEGKLSDIQYVVSEARLEKLKPITIVLDLTHGRLRAMQYHPSARWLEEHGYSNELAKCVHICDAADFARARQVNEQPWVVLHELAHAYHDQVLGFNDARIQAAYEKFKQSGHGESVLLYDGTHTRHYALTDPKEFFAEFTETYFGLNDFFPFNRAELKLAEPEIYALMADIWGPILTGSPPHHNSSSEPSRLQGSASGQ
jgi:hypothetical protein